MIRILIVEDDENITKMLCATLSISDYAYDCCGDGDQAVQMLLQNSYDLALLDVMLPGKDGFAVLDIIRAAGCETAVIFLTALGSVTDKVRGLHSGAEDYIVKPFEVMELLARIEVVLRRTKKAQPLLQYGSITVDVDKHMVWQNGDPVSTTPKEFDVLVFFLQNQDLVVTRKQLLANIWGYSFLGETRTVDIHVQQIRRKFQLQGKLVTVPKLGYRLDRMETL